MVLLYVIHPFNVSDQKPIQTYNLTYIQTVLIKYNDMDGTVTGFKNKVAPTPSHSVVS